jgi:S1-C subfamily serine protease
MAEGFYHPSQKAIPHVSVDRLCGAMVRVLPRTMLVLDVVDSQADADALARNERQADGSEYWYRFFTKEDIARVHDPEFAMGMVRHEFSRLVNSGATFPASVWLDGGGTGFCIGDRGSVLTNYHLVTADVANFARESGAINSEVLCRGLRAEIASKNSRGDWVWTEAREVWLVSNPPTDRALWSDGQGLLHPREDTAMLRVVPAPAAMFDLSTRVPSVGEAVWMAGFPIRSARSEQSRSALGYSDADSTLRISSGLVTSVDGESYFSSDLDGSMGNSGSPVFDETGRVVGMFSRATGKGPRNAFEYGHVERVHVTIALAAAGLHLHGE